MLPAFLTVVLISIAMWNMTSKADLIETHIKLTKEFFDEHHATEEMKTQMFYSQGSEMADEINKFYFGCEMSRHDWKVNETYCCIKASYLDLKYKLYLSCTITLNPFILEYVG